MTSDRGVEALTHDAKACLAANQCCSLGESGEKPKQGGEKEGYSANREPTSVYRRNRLSSLCHRRPLCATLLSLNSAPGGTERRGKNFQRAPGLGQAGWHTCRPQRLLQQRQKRHSRRLVPPMMLTSSWQLAGHASLHASLGRSHAFQGAKEASLSPGAVMGWAVLCSAIASGQAYAGSVVRRCIMQIEQQT